MSGEKEDAIKVEPQKLDMPKEYEWAIVLHNNANGLLVMSFDLFSKFQEAFWEAECEDTKKNAILGDRNAMNAFEGAWGARSRYPYDSLSPLAETFFNSLQVHEYFKTKSKGSLRTSTNSFIKIGIRKWRAKFAGMVALGSYNALMTLSKFEQSILKAIEDLNKSEEEAAELGVFDDFLRVSKQTWKDLDNVKLNEIGSKFQFEAKDKLLDTFATEWLDQNRDKFMLEELKKIADDDRLARFCAKLTSSSVSTSMDLDPEYFIVTE